MTDENVQEAEVVDNARNEEEEAVIRWDGSNMKSSYANVCNVTSTREEMTLLFGTNQTWHNGQKELVVTLSDRIVLNPYAAKRLSLLLGNVVNEYENQFGTLELDLPENPA